MEPSTTADVYDPELLQHTWLPVWDELQPFRSGDPADQRPKKYVLDMFPYPSGDLHMGHAEAYALGDVLARYWVQRGFNVLHPIGWDAFGLPAENAAIKRGVDPTAWTYENIEQQKSSMRRYACSFDWDRVLNTCDPEYYRWNQWLFLRMFERGLAYRKDSQVNWCPNDQTVLANEQVVNGRCERCDALVTKKKLTQWYLRITDYADRLLADMEQLQGAWPEKVLLMQRNWIGRSTGAEVDFAIEGRAEPVTVYTTRPDTLFGATFFVVAADSDLAAELATGSPAEQEFADYVERVKLTSELDRLATDREKTGVFLHRYAVNPVNGARLPIWASDYVLADYGTGAIMAVPAHDQRDLDFARTFDLPVQVVVEAGEDPNETGVATVRRRCHGQQRTVERAGQGRSDHADHRDPGRARNRPTRGELPAARLAHLAAALLGNPHPDHPLSRLRRGAGARRPTAGAAARSRGSGPHPAGILTTRGSDIVACRGVPRLRCGRATRPRHHGHVRRLVVVLPAVPRSPQRDRPIRPAAGAGVVAGRPVRRRRHPRDSAPAVRAVLHQGPARHGHARLHRTVHPVAQPGHGRHERFRHVQVPREPGATDRRARRQRGRCRTADAWCSPVLPRMTSTGPMSRRREPNGSSHGPGGWLGDVTSSPGSDVAQGDLGVRQATHRAVDEAQTAVESFRFNVAVARTMELVNVLRKAVDARCRRRRPRGA
ncbi:MAG: class I tRNA ligase family protein [Candidatus Nanopelagicales bacterium]